MERRRVVKRVTESGERGAPAALQRAAENLHEVLDATVVFASEMSADGVLHCLGVAPSDKARFAPVHLGFFPEGSAVLDEDRRALFSRSYHIPAEAVVVSVPVTNGNGFRALLTAVLPEAPGIQTLRMLDAWAALLAESVEGEYAHRALDMRANTVHRLRDVMELILSLTSEVVVAVDLDGHVLRWNNGASRLYGWNEDEVMDQVLPMIEPEHRSRALVRLREAAAAAPLLHSDALGHVTADGKRLRLRGTAMPLIDEDGDVYGLVALMQPPEAIMGQHPPAPPGVSEAALARLAAPITAISGFAQLLARGDILSDPLVRESALRGLERRCREVSDVAEELHLVTRLLETSPTLRLSTEDPGSALHRSVERALGKQAARVSVQADEGLSAQVDLECLEGALVGLLRGLLRCHPNDAVLDVTVRSEGPDVAIVFNARPGNGTVFADHPDAGLGIHLARLCASAHGGSFGVRSERDATEVRLVMPSQAAN